MIKCLLRPAMGVFILFISCCSCTRGQDKAIPAVRDSTIIYNIPNATEIPAAEFQRIKTGAQLFFDTLLKRSGFNGGMLVARHGTVIFEQYKGTVNLDGKDSVNEKTSMHVASVSKTFTAMAILKMQEQGKLNINDSVSKYIPGFNYPGVTIKTLLDHRSGLPNYNHFFEKTTWKDSVLSNNDVLRYLVDHKQDLENIGRSDRGFNYCNTNYALLAIIIENISNTPFPQYMQQNVFGPLGLVNTFVRFKGDNREVTKSFDWRGGEIPDMYLDMVYGDKNVYTTPRDLLRWDRALADTVFLKAESLAAAYEPYSNEKKGIKNYGLGWHMNIYPDGKKIIFHNGWWHGSTAAFIRLVKEDATIILIGNRYARSVYKAKNLVNLFNYYFDSDKEEGDAGAAAESGNEPAKPAPAARKISRKITARKLPARKKG